MTSIATNTPASSQPGACPEWCASSPCSGEHWSKDEEIVLSCGEKYETAAGGMYPDHVAVSTYTDPDEGIPAVGLRHVDHYVGTMTPAEAIALAGALGRAALAARSGTLAAPGPDSCPTWCEIAGDHEAQDGGRMRHATVDMLYLSAYPFSFAGKQHLDWLNVSRSQVRDGEPVIVIEKPDDNGHDPDRHMEVPARQVMLGAGEAVELAISLLGLAVDPETSRATRAQPSA